MSGDLWEAALDWQAYLEDATAGIRDNAAARAVREELQVRLRLALSRDRQVGRGGGVRGRDPAAPVTVRIGPGRRSIVQHLDLV